MPDSSLDELSFENTKPERLEKTQSQSAYYQHETPKQPDAKRFKIALNKENVQPFSKIPLVETKREGIKANQYSSKALQKMDPDIVRDLLEL